MKSLKLIFIFFVLTPSTYALNVEVLRTSNWKYLIELNPYLLGEYSRFMNAGVPMGEMRMTEISKEALAEEVKKANPNMSKDELEKALIQIRANLDYLDQRAKKLQGFLGEVRIAKDERVEDISKSLSSVQDLAKTSIQIGLWKGQDLQRSGRAKLNTFGEPQASNQERCIQGAIQTFSKMINIQETLELNQNGLFQKEAKAFKLPQTNEEGANLLLPLSSLSRTFLTGHFPCSEYFEPYSLQLESLELNVYKRNRDLLIILNDLASIKDEARLEKYILVLEWAFQPGSASIPSRYLWLRARNADLAQHDLKEFAHETLRQLEKERPLFAREIETLKQKVDEL